jgi:uncharacterized protein
MSFTALSNNLEVTISNHVLPENQTVNFRDLTTGRVISLSCFLFSNRPFLSVGRQFNAAVFLAVNYPNFSKMEKIALSLNELSTSLFLPLLTVQTSSRQNNFGAIVLSWVKERLNQDYVQQFANQSFTDPQSSYNSMCADRRGVQFHLDGPVYELIQKASQGDAQAQFDYAKMYCSGSNGVTENLDNALYYFKKAAAQGHVKAQFNCGVMAFNGEGQETDLPLARRIFESIIDKSLQEKKDVFYPAYLNCAIMCYDGIGGDRDLDKAKICFKLCAEDNNAEAQYMYAYMCFTEAGEVNLTCARSYFKKAALQSHVVAQYNYAVMCSEGIGGVKNALEAKEMFKKSANQGYPNAQFNYALICENEKDRYRAPSDAKKYYNLAAAQGHKEAQNALLRLALYVISK